MDRRQRNKKSGASLLASLITKAIYVFVTIGLISFVCSSVFPNASVESMLGYFLEEEAVTDENLNTVLLPTELPTPSTAVIPTFTSTPIPTPTMQPTILPTATNTPTPTPTPTLTLTPTVTPIPTPVFTGASYIVVNHTTGDILLSENPEQRILPASTIKLLTAMVTLDRLDKDTRLTLTEEALKDIQPDVANFGVPAGTTYSLEVWLHLLLIRSFGDAANAIAEGTAGSTERFIALMNEKVAELGLVNTMVDNAIGLDIGNGFTNIYSTAEDMLAITEAALSYPLIREIIEKVTYQVPASGSVAATYISSTNPLLFDAGIYYSDSFVPVGGKTGTTKAAGNCLVTLVTGMDGNEYLCVYFGGLNRDTMSREIVSLFEYAIQFYINSQS